VGQKRGIEKKKLLLQQAVACKKQRDIALVNKF